MHHDGGFTAGKGLPALQRRGVLVEHRGHDLADRERLLAPGVAALGEELAHRGKTADPVVGAACDIARHRVRAGPLARPLLARCDVGVVVVTQQQFVGAFQVGRGVLRLAVAGHDLQAADAFVRFCRHRTRDLERALARQHHVAPRRHHQRAAAMHQHRRFGVPVRLRADARPVDQHVDHAASFRELDDATQHCRGPVEVLGAGVEGDAGTARQGHPFHGHAQRFGVVERGDDAAALAFAQRAHVLVRVAEQQHAAEAVGETF